MADYGVVLADPPWKYKFARSKSRRVENHYPTMTVEEICQVDVPARRDAVLYLWATAPKLLEALMVMAAWGFVYKTQAVWDKVHTGQGYWVRGRHEILLIGTRGRISPPAESNRWPSVIVAPRGKHSRKPDAVYKMIEAGFPQLKKVEMFARVARPGWGNRGNEV